jgi:hypothetical protein
MARTYVDGKVHVRRAQCATCIGRPGNLMHLEPGRVESMVADAQPDGCIPCHAHLYQGAHVEPVCRWFYDNHATRPIRIAERLGLIEWVTA